MAAISEHIKDCEDMLGNGWKKVHVWLDEFTKIYWPKMVHRVHRHHLEGVEEVRILWGDEAAEAAEIHIRKDEGSVLSKAAIEQRYGVKWENEAEIKARKDSQNCP